MIVLREIKSNITSKAKTATAAQQEELEQTRLEQTRKIESEARLLREKLGR